MSIWPYALILCGIIAAICLALLLAPQAPEPQHSWPPDDDPDGDPIPSVGEHVRAIAERIYVIATEDDFEPCAGSDMGPLADSVEEAVRLNNERVARQAEDDFEPCGRASRVGVTFRRPSDTARVVGLAEMGEFQGPGSSADRARMELAMGSAIDDYRRYRRDPRANLPIALLYGDGVTDDSRALNEIASGRAIAKAALPSERVWRHPDDAPPAVPFYDRKADEALVGTDHLFGFERHRDAQRIRVEVLHALWNGQVSKEGIAQLLRDGADIGKFTADRARRALAAIEAGKPMMDRIHGLLEERGEQDVSVTIVHRSTGKYRAILIRGGRRGSAFLEADMGLNEFTHAVIGATEKLRPPLEGSFLGAAGGPEDVFEQGPVSAKGEDGGEG